jgi:hypothetical protein
MELHGYYSASERAAVYRRKAAALGDMHSEYAKIGKEVKSLRDRFAKTGLFGAEEREQLTKRINELTKRRKEISATAKKEYDVSPDLMSEKIKEYAYISETLVENLSKGQDASERRISLDYYTDNFTGHYKSVMELPSAEEISRLFEGAKSNIKKRLLGNKQDYYDTESYFKSAESRLNTVVSEVPIRRQHASSGQADTVRINLIIDLRNNIKAQNSRGYARWAKLFNLKQAAQTLAYLEENNLASYEKLYTASDAAQKEFTAIRTEIASSEQRLKDNAATQKYLRQYARTREVYADYKKSGYSKAFRSEHERDISQHQEAKKFFDGQGFAKGQKLPKISELKEEYAETLAKKKSLYPRYSNLKERTANVITAKKNIDLYLGIKAQEAYLRDDIRRVGASDPRRARRGD